MKDILKCFFIFWRFKSFSEYCLFEFGFLADILRESNEFFFELIFSMESCNSSLRFLMVMNKFLCMSEYIRENWSHSLMKFEFRYFRIDTEKMLCNLIFFSSSAYEIYGFFLGLIWVKSKSTYSTLHESSIIMPCTSSTRNSFCFRKFLLSQIPCFLIYYTRTWHTNPLWSVSISFDYLRTFSFCLRFITVKYSCRSFSMKNTSNKCWPKESGLFLIFISSCRNSSGTQDICNLSEGFILIHIELKYLFENLSLFMIFYQKIPSSIVFFFVAIWSKLTMREVSFFRTCLPT